MELEFSQITFYSIPEDLGMKIQCENFVKPVKKKSPMFWLEVIACLVELIKVSLSLEYLLTSLLHCVVFYSV